MNKIIIWSVLILIFLFVLIFWIASTYYFLSNYNQFELKELNKESTGTLKIIENPEPSQWGIVCAGNYTTKVNKTFIGCAKE